jgi:tRNA A37 methylthiotransferase MiaB
MKALLILLAVVLVLGCTSSSQEKSAKQVAEENCVALCKQATNISNGPCLSDNVAPDWVCDVAHSPRNDIDNLPENQCIGFRNGLAHHFVEVDEGCNIIRSG